MKYLIIAASFCVLVCTVSGFRSQPGEIVPQLALGKVAGLSHHLNKRQTTPSLEDLAGCADTAFGYLCGSSGYAQGLVDIALGCRNDSFARDIAIRCSRTEGGDLCITQASRIVLDASLAVDASSCTDAVSSESCPSTCSSFLQSMSSRLGCCINTVLNTTESGMVDPLYDNRLWGLCNVPLPPSSSCENGLQLNPPQDTQQCTFQQLEAQSANYQCMPSVGQPFIDTLQQNSKCDGITQVIVEYCSVNQNNEFCVAVTGSDVTSDAVMPSNNPMYMSLLTDCSSSSSTSCSPSCQSAISDISNSFGCCVNVFNDTNSGPPELSYGLWNRCGMQTPGVCATSTLRQSGATTVQGFAWMIAIAMALCMALCI